MRFLSKFLLPTIRRNVDLWPVVMSMGAGATCVLLSFAYQLNSRDCKVWRVSSNRQYPLEQFRQGSAVLWFPNGLPQDQVPKEVKETMKGLGPYYD